MKRLKFGVIYVVYLLILIQIERKLRISSESVYFLRENAVQGMQFDQSQKLLQILKENPRPAVILLNKHALNITINFLCNVKLFRRETPNYKVLVFAFDEFSHSTLSSAFPEDIDVVYWPIPALQDAFKASDGRYQLFQLFRANLCAFLSRQVGSFWMIQADTIWRTNFFRHFDTSLLTENDIVFDSEGERGLLARMIAGGYFHVNSSDKTAHFFEEISSTLLEYYVTDNNLMGKQCIEQSFGVKCGSLPYRDVVNWRWNRPEVISDETLLPLFLQFDGGEGAESKFQKMNQLGAAFVDIDTLPSESTPRSDNRITCLSKSTTDGVLDEKRFIFGKKNVEKSNFAIKFFHSLFEFLNRNLPFFEHFIISKLFPFYAYYLVI